MWPTRTLFRTPALALLAPAHGRLARVALGLIALVSAPLAGVLTVGPAGSGAQFTEIQAAIDAAQDDDVILVRPGTYARFVVERPLRILGAGAGNVTVAGLGFAAQVRDIGPGEELVLSGLTLHALGSLEPVVLVEDAPGSVVLHDLALPVANIDRPGLQLEDCARVVLLDSLVRGGVLGGFGRAQRGALLALRSELWLARTEIVGSGTDHFVTQEGAHGLEVDSCAVRLWSSRLSAGGSGVTLMGSSGTGGTGLRAVASRLDLFGGPGAEIRGGHGAFETTISRAYPGGPGLDLRLGSTARIQAALPIAGGFDGLDQVQAASVLVDGSSSFVLRPQVFPTLASSAPQAALGSTVTLTLAGNPGGLQVVHLALRTGPTLLPRGVAGAGWLDPSNLVLLPAVTLPASGSAVLSFPVPSLPSLLGATLFLQSVERLGGRFALGNPAAVTVTG